MAKLAKTLGGTRTRWIQAKDPSGVHNRKPFVSDERLMLKHPGTKYSAIDLNMVMANTKDEVRALDIEELEEILDMCAACLDLSSAPRDLGPAQRKA